MILLRLESSKARWTSRALSNIRHFDQRGVPKTVSFGTNVGGPEIKAFSVPKVSPKMEVKWWPSQRWVASDAVPKLCPEARHRFRLPPGLLGVCEFTPPLCPRCADLAGAPMAQRRKVTASSAKPGNEMVDTPSRRFAPPALLQIANAARTQDFTRVQSRSLRWPMTVSSERCAVST